MIKYLLHIIIVGVLIIGFSPIIVQARSNDKYDSNEVDIGYFDNKFYNENNYEYKNEYDDEYKNENDDYENDNNYYGDEYLELYDMLGIEDINEKLRNSNIETTINFDELINELISGDLKGVGNEFIIGIKRAIAGGIKENRNFMIQAVAIILIGSIFVNLSNSFSGGFVSENGFYITYLIITSLLIMSFSIMMETVINSIEGILVVVKVMIPVYIIALNYLGEVASATALYQIILIGIWLVEVVIIRFVLPMIKFYVILTLINNINKEDSFSKMAQLIKSFVNWSLKSIIFLIAGINIIKSLIAPAIDSLNKNAVSKLLGAMPGGSMVYLLTQTMLGSGKVLKNALGVGGIISILVIVTIPIIKIFIMMLTVRITTILVQPLGEKRYQAGLQALVDGSVMLLYSVSSGVVLFVLSIAIMSYATGG